MKPDWDKLMKKYEDDKVRMVGDVDCTAAGKPLCDSNGVKGFPTIKYGDPNDLQDYQGSREYKALDTFAETKLGPSCGPAHPDLCNEVQKKLLDEYMSWSVGKLEAKISNAEKELVAAEENFKTETDKLQAIYKKLSEDKDATIEKLKNSGLNRMKAVRSDRALKGEKFKSMEKTLLEQAYASFRKVLSAVGLGGAPPIMVAIVVASLGSIIGMILLCLCCMGDDEDEQAEDRQKKPAAKKEEAVEAEEADEDEEEEEEKEPKKDK